MSGDVIRHAGLVALRAAGSWRGVLIEGPSGSGKSDLALRALGVGFRLVADDRVLLWASDGRLFGRAPDTLNGLMELRGLEVARIGSLPMAEIALVVCHGIGERIPEPAFADILGLKMPRLELALGELSAPAKLSHALTVFDAAAKRRI
ncbi:MAG: HPr kinase/phosphorylase [Phenylobacterium sp.]